MNTSKVEKQYKASLPKKIISFFENGLYKKYYDKIVPEPSYEPKGSI